ncbi:hypothetical protein [Halobacillus halophilus]|nr:hypothetical protein [Halobacillus halophilus]
MKNIVQGLTLVFPFILVGYLLLTRYTDLPYSSGLTILSFFLMMMFLGIDFLLEKRKPAAWIFISTSVLILLMMFLY